MADGTSEIELFAKDFDPDFNIVLQRALCERAAEEAKLPSEECSESMLGVVTVLQNTC